MFGVIAYSVLYKLKRINSKVFLHQSLSFKAFFFLVFLYCNFSFVHFSYSFYPYINTLIQTYNRFSSLIVIFYKRALFNHVLHWLVTLNTGSSLWRALSLMETVCEAVYNHTYSIGQSQVYIQAPHDFLFTNAVLTIRRQWYIWSLF